MAAEPVVLRNILCFLVNKFGEIAVKPLKIMTVELFDIDELYGARCQFV